MSRSSIRPNASDILKRALGAMCASAVVLLSSPAHAFKIDTHMLIAHQVWQDAKDGYIEIRTLGKGVIKVPIAPEFRQALRSKGTAPYFLMGSIGPDAFPGIFEGQMAIHPGALNEKGIADASRWSTSEWALQLLSKARESNDKKELAFAYGVLTHLAGDIFAHTYVNEYAGNAWSLSDDETVVEQRHFLLEGYIAKMNPPFPRNRPAASLMGTQHEIHGIPSGLLTDDWILAPVVADRFAAAQAPHIKAISELYWRLDKLASDDGDLRKIEKRVKQYFFDKYVGIPLSEEQYQKLHELDVEYQTKLKGKVNKAQREVHDWMWEVAEVVTVDRKTAESKIALQQVESVQKAIEPARKAMGLQKDAEKLHSDAKKRFDNRRKKILANVPCPFFWSDRECDKAKKAALKADDALSGLRDGVDKTASELRSKRAQVSVNTETLAQAVNDLNTAVKQAIDGLHVTEKEATNQLARFNSSTNAAVEALWGWNQDIRRAMSNYYVANAQILRSALLPKDAKDRAPLWGTMQTWLECDLRRIAGQGPLVNIPCTANQELAKFRDAWSKFETSFWNSVHPGLGTKLEDLNKDIQLCLDNAVFDIATRTLVQDKSLQSFIKVLDTEPTGDALQAAFDSSEHNERLLLIPKIADRINADARAKKQRFSPTEFPAYANALTLAKLTLLDAKGLNMLATKLGVTPPGIYGTSLYDESKSWNVLQFVALSIDHNHQWHEQPPMYPRSSAPFAPAAVAAFQHGPEDGPAVYGLRLWVDEEARDKIFRQVFIGPLAAALETPAIFPGLDAVLPVDYGYRTCIDDPFPSDYARSKCGAAPP